MSRFLHCRRIGLHACVTKERQPRRDALTLAEFRRLVDEGQELRRAFDRDTAPSKAITADDCARVSR